ncbi:MAG: protein kinase [Planctomycetota bacterium]
MKPERPTCSRCGTSLPADHDPKTPCPSCLMAEGIRPETPASRGEPTLDDLREHFPTLELEERIGRGGMGVVFRARHRELERTVALKILHLAGGVDPEDPSFDERFQREARAMAGLSHPGIAAVYDFGAAGPWKYLVLEYIDGTDLRQMIRSKAVRPREALSIVNQICEALQYAHDRGVVHRDIKPENVLVGRDGRIKLVDFGLAKLSEPDQPHLTMTGQAMGTWHYMAPEQIEHPLEVDHRADIFSLGVVFYELLTGELPVGRFASPSERVEVDVRLDEVVLRALEKDPAKRYQSATAVRTEITRSLEPPAAAAAAAGSVTAQGGAQKVSGGATEGAAPRKRTSSLGCWIIGIVLLLFLIPGCFLSLFMVAPGYGSHGRLAARAGVGAAGGGSL